MVLKYGDFLRVTNSVSKVLEHKKGIITILWSNGNTNSWTSLEVKENMDGGYWKIATSAEVLLYWTNPKPNKIINDYFKNYYLGDV